MAKLAFTYRLRARATEENDCLKGLFQIAAAGTVAVVCSLSAQAGGAGADPAKPVQFKSQQHLVGFEPDRVYLASFDHALSVEFLGAKRVTPTVISARAANSKDHGAFLGRVEYRNPWNGVTVRYDAVESGIAESTYLVEAGADVNAIRLKYNVPVQTDADGSLEFRLPSQNGWMKETAPVAWQEIDGRKVAVPVAFKVEDQKVGFQVGNYDHSRSLTIDPTYEWHTFYGQAQGDQADALAVDASGNVYVAGQSYNSLTPGTWTGPSGQAPLHAHSGGPDIMVMKLNSAGAYQWHTFYGDADRQWANGIAVDASGNVYVTGFTDGAQWLGANNAAPLHYGQADGEHAVILKLDTNGAYQWHTFYGNAGDQGNAIAVSGGAVYVTGYTAPTNNPDWPGFTALHAHSGTGYDVFILKLNTSGAYQWHTFYGAATSNGSDVGNAVTVDGNGNVYVAGQSQLTWGTPLHDHSYPGTSGKPDIFVLKLNSSGAYQWHTFYGATYANPYWATGEVANGIAVDADANVYVTGYSSADWHGSAGESALHAYAGSQDLTVLKLDTDGAYQWHTFYGSDSHNYGHAIAVDTHGVYVAGDGFGSWLGDNNRAPIHALASNSGHIVLKLGFDGDYKWHTFYDHATSNTPHGIGTDGARHIYVSGASDASWLGDGDTAPLHAYTAANDITVFKLDDSRTIASTVSLLSPSGGEDWDAGTSQEIEWAAPAAADHFRLQYSVDKGLTWTTIAGAASVQDMYFDWSIPAVPKNKKTCLVKVDAFRANGTKIGSAKSSKPFEINVVEMVSLNGGETLQSGVPVSIYWWTGPTVRPIASVVIQYTTNGGLTWKKAGTAAGSATSYSWTPSVTRLSPKCRVKVVLKDAAGASLGSALSEAYFTVQP